MGRNFIESVPLFATLIIAILAVCFIFAWPLFSPISGIISGLLVTAKDNALLIAIITGLFATIGWAYTTLLKQMENRTQLLILEILSDGQPRSRQQIRDLLRKVSFLYRIYDVEFDALAALAGSGKVIVENQQYRVPVSTQGTGKPLVAQQ